MNIFKITIKEKRTENKESYFQSCSEEEVKEKLKNSKNSYFYHKDSINVEQEIDVKEVKEEWDVPLKIKFGYIVCKECGNRINPSQEIDGKDNLKNIMTSLWESHKETVQHKVYEEGVKKRKIGYVRLYGKHEEFLKEAGIPHKIHEVGGRLSAPKWVRRVLSGRGELSLRKRKRVAKIINKSKSLKEMQLNEEDYKLILKAMKYLPVTQANVDELEGKWYDLVYENTFKETE